MALHATWYMRSPTNDSFDPSVFSDCMTTHLLMLSSNIMLLFGFINLLIYLCVKDLSPPKIGFFGSLRVNVISLCFSFFKSSAAKVKVTFPAGPRLSLE